MLNTLSPLEPGYPGFPLAPADPYNTTDKKLITNQRIEYKHMTSVTSHNVKVTSQGPRNDFLLRVAKSFDMSSMQKICCNGP